MVMSRLAGTMTANGQLGAILSKTGELSANLGVGNSGGENVITKATRYEFPNIGKNTYLYVATEENAIYRWDNERLLYFCIGRDYEGIEIVKGGNANGE